MNTNQTEVGEQRTEVTAEPGALSQLAEIREIRVTSEDRQRAELVLQPWQWLKRDGNIGICAWCQKEQGVKPNPAESHGICPKHDAAVRAELAMVSAAIRPGGSSKQTQLDSAGGTHGSTVLLTTS